MVESPLISVAQLQSAPGDIVLLDCRFSLSDPDAGERDYRQGHIPGAIYLHLEHDLSAPVGEHGGRHPLPQAQAFCDRLAALGIGVDTEVVAYDDSRFAFASRLWWMLDALGFRNVRVLDGGLGAWLSAGGELDQRTPQRDPVQAHRADDYAGRLDIDGLRQAQAQGAILVDSREQKRFEGLEEPIDPVAGHIPGALNYPWQGVSGEDGQALPQGVQRQRWETLPPGEAPVVYCGSGVTACVNLLSLRLAGRQGARLYAGSWSDWCSYLE